MKSDPIMTELRKIKRQIAAENGYDLARIAASLKKWETSATIRSPSEVIEREKAMLEKSLRETQKTRSIEPKQKAPRKAKAAHKKSA